MLGKSPITMARKLSKVGKIVLGSTGLKSLKRSSTSMSSEGGALYMINSLRDIGSILSP
jgi:hypothetical protein